MSQTKFRFTDPVRAEELKKRCDQILEKIYDADSEDRALKQEYNRLSYEIEHLRRGFLPDPLLYLPPELWIPIIREVTKEHAATVSPIDALLVLTLVSRAWSTAILCNAVLWTDVAIGYGEPDAQAKLVTALHLSGSLQLNLRILDPPHQWEGYLPLLQSCPQRIRPHQWEEYFPLLQSCTQRIRSFIIDGSQPLHIHVSHIDSLLATLGHFPSLQAISIMPFAYSDMGAVASRSPLLTRAYGFITLWEEIIRRSGPPLRTCILLVPENQLLQPLQYFSHLEELELIINRGSSTTDPIIPSLHYLPALKTIRGLETLSDKSITLLRLAGNLTSLEIRIYEKQYLYDLLYILTDLPCLLLLDISLDAFFGKVSFPGMELIETRLQYLYVSNGYSRHETSEKLEDELRDGDEIFSVFSACFPDIQKLGTCNFAFGTNMAGYIRSATRLWSLTLDKISLQPGAVIESPGLEVLCIKNCKEIDTAHLVSTARSPSLSKLEWMIDVDGFNEVATRVPIVDRLEHLKDQDSIYSRITILIIDSMQTPTAIPKFSALRKLQVGVDIHGLYEIFISEPSLCPGLEEIQLGSISEWDLFFIMLERRNYLPASRCVARFSKLIVAHPIASMLLTPLTDILGGRFRERPSNYELSFASIMDTYCDLSIPGCRKCIESMIPCPEGLRTMIPPFNPPHWFQIGISKPLPAELREWLRSRNSHFKEWSQKHKELQKHGVQRAELCMQAKRADLPLIITG